jgi:Protein of unknown function with PCYCGC motif
MSASRSRRELLIAMGSALLTMVARPVKARADVRRPAGPRGPHPTPRPGITAERVPTAEQLAATPEVVEVFEHVRAIPGVIDGIRCHCGCADAEGHYSLLSCFETTTAMAIQCQVCQAHGKLAWRLHQAGRSLDEIRKGIDARFD